MPKPYSKTKITKIAVKEYNTFAPHSSLEMKTPNEFYIFKNSA